MPQTLQALAEFTAARLIGDGNLEVARVALHTGAAVVPAFNIWDPVLRRYRVEFDRALELVRTGNDEVDAVANTAIFTKVIEDYVRRYPDQWLWVHRRWKTRLAGEPGLY
jgi:Kdo2-lipid IVA lauroyltransferase/acyltransferase